jgi:pimeloyl-ACP methyl ester carboxylesterase
MNFKSKNIYAILLVIATAWSCTKEDIKPANESLITSESILTRYSGELKTFITASGINLPISQLTNDVELYKITYKTNYINAQQLTASGLVILPKTSGNYPMVSFHHGTIGAHNQAPSVVPLSSSELILYSALSSPGFITVIPDLLGFGSSSNITHPYYVEDLTASSVMDMLKAASELAREKGITFNGKLFLAGYSEGGYVTMATHKAIEKNGLQGFELVASFPSSGGYDVKGMQEYLFGTETYDQPFYLGYVAMAYKTAYSWTQPFSDIFKEPYASRVPTLYDGSKSGSQINAQLTTRIKDLVNEDLILKIGSDSKYKYIDDAFKQNSLTDWVPTKKMFMYHGDIDITVPYNNSVMTYNKLIANGASKSIVTFTTLKGTHETAVVPYIEAFIPKMLELK